MITAGAIKKKGTHFFSLNTNQLPFLAPQNAFLGG